MRLRRASKTGAWRIVMALPVLALGSAGCRGTSCFDPTVMFVVILGFVAVAVVGFNLTRN